MGIKRYSDGTGNYSVGLVEIANSANLDPFGRVRTSHGTSLFDAQFTYDLAPLLFEQVVTGSGATIAHETTERAAEMTFSSTPTGGQAYMQSYEHFRYQPGNGQLIFVTFNFREHATNSTKFAGYGDLSNNGVHFLSDGSGFAWRLLSNTSAGDQTIAQADWNVDPLNGTGPSEKVLDVTKTNIAVIDLQALYVGRVRVGFDIDGEIIVCHEFLHANTLAYPYIQTASLPVIFGMTCTGTVSTTMLGICCTVKTEGGTEDPSGYTFSASGNTQAASGARTHLLSIVPRLTFNGIQNRSRFMLENVDLVVTGSNPIKWELCVGQALSGASWADVNSTYSSVRADSSGSISGDPSLVIASGYVAATNQSKGNVSKSIVNRYPITLDVSGASRVLGTLSLVITGIGGVSNTYGVINWKEVR